MKNEPTLPATIKPYYDHPVLNQIANERKWGRIFGETTMLQIMNEAGDMGNPVDKQEFILEVEASL